MYHSSLNPYSFWNQSFTNYRSGTPFTVSKYKLIKVSVFRPILSSLSVPCTAAHGQSAHDMDQIKVRQIFGDRKWWNRAGISQALQYFSSLPLGMAESFPKVSFKVFRRIEFFSSASFSLFCMLSRLSSFSIMTIICKLFKILNNVSKFVCNVPKL